MDDIFWLLMLFPIVWPFIAKWIWHIEFTYAEMSINIIVVIILCGSMWAGGKYSQTIDTEILSGQVTNKKMQQETCPYGWVRYQDNFCTEYRTRQVKDGETCSTDSNGHRSCTPNYVTEYNYDFDWERKWFVYTNIERTYEISRIDRQGKNEPPRWTQVAVGDPAAKTVSYTNYIKAAANSLFHENEGYKELYKNKLPAYPQVYDYYKVDRVQAVGVKVDNIKEWNERLSLIQKKVGPLKQGNINIIFTDVDSPNYIKGLKSHWQGFKKNDIVIVVGLRGKEIIWADADSWSKMDIVNIMLRDEIINLKTLEIDPFFSIVEKEVMSQYQRRSMQEFEYLKDEIDPPMWIVILALIVAFIGSPLLTWVFNKPDVDIRFPWER